MSKEGAPRPVVIPMRNQLSEIVLGIARTIGLSRSDLEDYIRR